MQRAVLSWHMVLAAYAHSVRCPVLTWRVLAQFSVDYAWYGTREALYFASAASYHPERGAPEVRLRYLPALSA